MRRTRKDWWQTVADRRDEFLVKLYKEKATVTSHLLERAIFAQHGTDPSSSPSARR